MLNGTETSGSTLVANNGNTWNSPFGSPIGPNSGYLRVLSLTCYSCESLPKNLKCEDKIVSVINDGAQVNQVKYEKHFLVA